MKYLIRAILPIMLFIRFAGNQGKLALIIIWLYNSLVLKMNIFNLRIIITFAN